MTSSRRGRIRARNDEWDEAVYRMELTTDCNWSFALELYPGCEYQYRFRTPYGTWLQDPSAPPPQFGLNHSFLLGGNGMA